MKTPTNIMIHHSAVSRLKNPDQFKANNEYHRKLWNFKSSLGFYLGYHYEINNNGLVRQARADGEAAAACYQKNMNDGRCIHICLDGNFDLERPAANQIYALRDLMRPLKKRYPITLEAIFFHRQFANKTCPGLKLSLDFIRSLVI